MTAGRTVKYDWHRGMPRTASTPLFSISTSPTISRLSAPLRLLCLANFRLSISRGAVDSIRAKEEDWWSLIFKKEGSSRARKDKRIGGKKANFLLRAFVICIDAAFLVEFDVSHVGAHNRAWINYYNNSLMSSFSYSINQNVKLEKLCDRIVNKSNN